MANEKTTISVACPHNTGRPIELEFYGPPEDTRDYVLGECRKELFREMWSVMTSMHDSFAAIHSEVFCSAIDKHYRMTPNRPTGGDRYETSVLEHGEALSKNQMRASDWRDLLIENVFFTISRLAQKGMAVDSDPLFDRFDPPVPTLNELIQARLRQQPR
jgi:hypothetical protein